MRPAKIRAGEDAQPGGVRQSPYTGPWLLLCVPARKPLNEEFNMTHAISRRLPILLVALAALALALSGTPAQAQQGSAPDKPTGLTVTSVAEDAVTLSWDDPSDSSITHYQVLRRDRAVHAPGEFVTIEEDTGSSATAYTDTDVEPDKGYVYRVKAVNAHGVSGWSNYARADTPGPGPLTGFTVLDASDQTELAQLEDGDTLALDDPDGGSYGVRAEVDSSAQIGSVRLELTGARSVTQTENVAPYSLYGDDADGVHGEALPAGSYTLRATAYSESRGNGDELGTLAVSFTVTDGSPQPPANSPATGKPAVTGTAHVDETLTADTSAIEDPDGLTNPGYAYQWVRNNSVDDADIAGATSSDYTVADDDLGHVIKVRVSFTDDAGNAEELTSEPTAPVVAVTVNIIEGPTTALQTAGVTLVSNVGQGNTSEAGSSHDRAQRFTTGSNSGGYTLSSIDIISTDDEEDDATVAVYTVDTDGFPDELHASLTAPGSFTEGTLAFTAPAGTSLAANTTYTVVIGSPGGQIFQLGATTEDGEDSGAATGWSIANAYDLKSSGGDWSTTGSARSVRIAVKGSTSSPATGKPDITGTPQVGEKLEAGTSNITDSDGLTNVSYSYQWIAVDSSDNETDISGATESTYWPSASQVGNAIKVKVSFTDDTSNEEELTSDATDAVAPVAVTAVSADWSLVPEGLNVGDRFRLLFISIAERKAGSSNIRDYNVHVQNAANGGHADIQAHSDLFRAVGSTTAVDARDNTGTTYTSSDPGVPIYWLGGNKVVDDYADFYDGDWDDVANQVDETGTSQVNTEVWTGSDDDGTEFFNTTGDSRALGSPGNSWVRFGRPTGSGGPLSYNTANRNNNNPLYGLSGVFQVRGNPATGAPAIILHDPAATSPQVGERLTVDMSGIMDDEGVPDPSTDPDKFTYQWLADGVEIAGATHSSYAPLVDDVGKTIKVKVSFTDDKGVEEGPLTSAATAAVVASSKGNVIWSALLTVGHDPRPPDQLTYWGFAGLFLGSLDPSQFSYEDTDVTVTRLAHIKGRDAGRQLDNLSIILSSGLGEGRFNLHLGEVLLLIEDPGDETQIDIRNHGISWSDGQEVEVRLAVNREPEGEVAITGTVEVGQTLTADDSDVTDADGVGTLSYQWLRSDGVTGDEISGATGETYTLTDADGGLDVGVRVSYTDGAGFAESFTSDPYGPVTDTRVTIVPTDWALKPTAVADGGQFRLMFLSSETRNAVPENIATYNAWAQGLAASGHAGIQAYASHFRVVGCTVDDDARDNTVTTYTSSDKGVPIYWLNGNKAADEYEDFYDGDWDEESSMRDEDGATVTAQPGVASAYVLTGCENDGTKAEGSGVNPDAEYFGSPSWARAGNPGGTGSPFSHEVLANSAARRMYALSGVFEVQAANATGAPAIILHDPAATSPQVGERLTVDMSGIMDDEGVPDPSTDPDKFTYQWVLVDGMTETDIEGATRSSYAPVVDDIGKTIKVNVSFTDDEGGEEGPLTSAATAAVVASDLGNVVWSALLTVQEYAVSSSLTWVGSFIGGEQNLVPDRFVYDGDEHFVNRLQYTVFNGQPGNLELVFDNPSVSLSSKKLWLHLDSSSFLIEEPATATWLNADNHGLGWTDGQEVEVRLVANREPEGEVAITGTAEVGQTLTADASGVTDADGLGTFSYQWLRSDGVDDTEISGATDTTYTLTDADGGLDVKVRVSYTDGLNFSESLTSTVGPVTDTRVTVVPSTWALTPSSLSQVQGAKFRLLFLTSATRTAQATNIATYNAWAQGLAESGHADIQAYASRFRVVGCTADDDARDNTSTTYTSTDKGVPIYWLNGNKAADEYEDFYDGSWDEEASMRDEDGATVTGTANVWTGCDHNGTESFSGTTSWALGKSAANIGRPNSAVSGQGPISSGGSSAGNTNSLKMYALSGVFEVSTGPGVASVSFSGVMRDSATVTVAVANLDSVSHTVHLRYKKTDDTAWTGAGSMDTTGTDVTFNLSGLDGNTDYDVEASLESDFSAGVVAETLTTSPVEPSKPTSLNVVPFDGSLLISWNAPSDDGGDSIIDYRVQWKSGTQGWDAVNRQVTETGTSTAVPNLTNGVEYTLRVLARNSVGLSPPSLTTTGTPFGPPPAPSSVAARSGDTKLTVTWEQPNDGGRAISEYTVQWKSGNQSWSSTRQATVTGSPPQMSHVITGLINDTEYTVRVQATNDQGDSDWSAEATGTPRSGPTVTDITKFGDISCYGTRYELYYANLEPSTFYVAYVRFRAQGAQEWTGVGPQGFWSSADPTLALQGELVGDRPVFRLGNLDSNTTYEVQAALDENFIDGVASATFTTPNLPVTPTPTMSRGTRSLALAWGAPNTPARVVGYLVQWKSGSEEYDDSDGSERQADVTGNGNGGEHTITGLTNGVEYTVRVVAYNDDGVGVPSDELRGTPEAPPNSPATGKPTISGTVRVGETLTASASDIEDADGMDNATFAYQWLADNVEIAGATGDSYTLTADEEGAAIQVRVSFTDDADHEESLTSDPTAAVKEALDGSPIWTATLTVGDLSYIAGYWHGLTGSLEPDTFWLDGVERRVNVLADVTGFDFYFEVSGFDAIGSAFTLEVGDAIFESTDAGRPHGADSATYNWAGRSLDLPAGSVVEVTLTLTE